jgi:guanylate cyclase
MIKRALERAGERLLRLAEGLICEESDTGDARLRKTLLMAAVLAEWPAALGWGVIYLVFGEPLAALVPLSYVVMVSANIVVFWSTRRLAPFRLIHLSTTLLLPFLLMLALGRFMASSAVVLWAVIAPMGALIFTSRKEAGIWVIAFVLLIALGGVLDPFLDGNGLPAVVVRIFFVMNILGPSSIALGMLIYFTGQQEQAMKLLHLEQVKSDRLLLNVLPAKIAPLLRDGHRVVAERFDDVSVLFADIVGSTALTVELEPERMVELLNEVFSYFDSVTERYGAEKIRTIGDNYMVPAGVPEVRQDHAQAIAGMALEMLDYVQERTAEDSGRLQFRIGINSGPAVAGVVGTTKFHYDIWGDTVNVASRMESQGEPGMVQVTRATYELIKDEFVCVPRGTLDVKGRGVMETWFLERRAADNGDRP